MLYHLSQSNPQWRNNPIGATKTTIAQAGCTLTCVSMLSSYFGCYLSPAQIASHAGWFNADAQMLWPKLDFTHMRFAWREYGFVPALVDASLADPNKAAIVRVSMGGGFHWLVAIQKEGADYLCVNPLGGGTCLVEHTYGPINGSAHFERK